VLFADMGFGQVLVYLHGDIKKSANTAFILCTGTVAAFAVLLWIGAPLIGVAFSEPAVVWPLRAMAPVLILVGANAVPAVLLDKDLKFKKKALIEVPGAFAYAVVAISLASLDYGIWSLVLSWNVMTVISCAITWAISPWRPKFEFGMPESRKIIVYGSHLIAGTITAFAFLQIDKLSIGKWLGMTQLGYYSVAFTVCNLPVTNLTAVVNRVMFPAYSRLVGLSEIREMYLRMAKHLALIVFPAAMCFILLSKPIIHVVYGAKWAPAVPFFYVLAIFGLFRAFGTTSDAVFMATDNPALIRKVNLIQLVIAGIFVYPVASLMGTLWVAILFTFTALVGTAFALFKVHRMLKIRLANWADILGTPSIATILAGSIAFIGHGDMSWFLIFRILAVFAIFYVGIILLLDRSLYREVAATFRRAA
jgi:O-antigen/teichoic acid export membrane protein